MKRRTVLGSLLASLLPLPSVAKPLDPEFPTLVDIKFYSPGEMPCYDKDGKEFKGYVQCIVYKRGDKEFISYSIEDVEVVNAQPDPEAYLHKAWTRNLDSCYDMALHS